MKRLILILIATLALFGVVSAQESKDKELQAKERLAKERQELEKKTVAFLNEVASAAWSLKTFENRMFVMTSAADLLWSHDQKRARSLYWDVLNMINSTPEVHLPKEQLEKAELERLAQAYSRVFMLKQHILRQVARRDAQLALDMLRATRQVLPRQLIERGVGYENQLEQEIAAEVAARDPAQALRLARESLAKGLSFGVLNLLQRLNHKDGEKALVLAGEIITKLRSINIATDVRGSVMAIQLLHFSRTRTDGAVVGQLSNTSDSYYPTHLALNDEQRRDLVDSLTSAALGTSANSHLLYQIRLLEPEIDQFFPERREPLERKLASFNQTLNKEQRQQEVYNSLIVRGQPEELVRAAANASDDERLALYQQAAIIALNRGQTESFRDSVAREIKDSDEQNKILDALDTQEIDLAAGRKQLENLERLIPKIRRKEERARAMAELALMLKEKGEDHAASSLLDDAATLIKTDLKSETHSNALLTLMSVYALVDPPKAFVMAERTIDQANKQISTLMLVDRVIKSGAIKKGEILLDRGGILPLDLMVFKYGKGVAALATADFNRTRALADRFDRNELRLMARLLILKALLQPNPTGDAILFERTQ
jgi:hypothetical protein